jgi:PAS domain S-box-containing protein
MEQIITPLQQYEYVFELVNDSVMTRTMEGRINFWNRGAEELYGWSKEEAIGKVSHDLLQTKFPQPLEEIESELVRTRQWEGKLVHTTRDGRRVVVESRWTLEISAKSRALVEINTRCADNELPTDESATDRKRAQNPMEQTVTPLQQYEYFFELVNDSVMTRTMEGRINFWNRSAEELYGWRKEEAIGRVSHNLLQTKFPQPLEEIEAELVRNGQWEGRLVHITRDGYRVVVESRWTLDLRGQSGALIEINTRSTDCELDAGAPSDAYSTKIGREELLPRSTLAKVAWTQLFGIGGAVLGTVWILYLLFGHQLIRLLYNIELLNSVVMKQRAYNPVDIYYRQADEVLVLSTIVLVTLFVLMLLIQKPLGVLLAGLSVTVCAFIVFCIFEFFPSLIESFHLDTIAYYYGYKTNYIYDDKLVYREKPFINTVSHGFRGSHYSPLYGVDVPPVTVEYILDENGFRNTPGKQSADVAVLGDSYVVFGNNEADTFVGRLEKKLSGLTVVNLGASGYGPFQYLEVLKRYGVKYKPKYVLFGFFEGNDIYDVEGYLQWKEGRVKKDTSLFYRVQQMSFIERYWELFAKVGVSIRKEMDFLIQLALYRMAEAGGYSEAIHPDLASLDIGDNKNYRVLFIDRVNTRPAAEMLRTKEWQAFKAILNEFKQVCAENKIVPVIMYIPTPVHIYGQYSTKASGKNWLGVRDKQIAAKENTERAVQELAYELKIDFISLSPVFEGAAKEGKLLYMQLDSHWNSEGREIAADFVANALKSTFILPAAKLEHKNTNAGESN